MIRLTFVWAAVVSAAFAQAPSTDSQTLQALLDEVRQLRQDLKANATLGQRSQLLISRLQIQQSAVDKAAQRVESARAELGKSQERRKDFTAHLKFMENEAANNSGAANSKEKSGEVERFKAALDKSFAEEQEQQAVVTSSEDQLRTEQARLAAIQDELDQIDKSLKKP